MKLFLVKFTVSSSTYMNDDERDDEYTRMVEAVDEDHVERIIKNQPEFKTDEYSVYRRVYFDEITTVLRDSSNSSPDELPADMEARTPAPEGEVLLWGCADGNGIDPRLVFRDRPTAEQVAVDTNMVVQPLYASPVVPVGVGREDIAAMAWRFRGNERLGGPWYDGAKPSDSPAMHDCFAFADAILATLRFTDTGRE